MLWKHLVFFVVVFHHCHWDGHRYSSVLNHGMENQWRLMGKNMFDYEMVNGVFKVVNRFDNS